MTDEQVKQITDAINGTNERLDNLQLYLKEQDEKEELEKQEQLKQQQEQLEAEKAVPKTSSEPIQSIDYTTTLTNIEATTVKLEKSVNEIGTHGITTLTVILMFVAFSVGISLARTFWRKL